MAGYRLMMRHNERVITINATLQFLAFFFITNNEFKY